MSHHSTKIERRCEICGKTFYILPSVARAGNGQMCSKACRTVSHRVSVEETFWSNVGRKTAAGCILWTASVDRKGYGQIVRSGHSFRASRVAYELMVGPITDGLFVLHSCDNRRCIRPTHLFLGTNQDNVTDMVSKGRNTFGERSGTAKLTEAQVLEARARYAAGESQGSIAKELHVCQATISLIVSRKKWKHV